MQVRKSDCETEVIRTVAEKKPKKPRGPVTYAGLMKMAEAYQVEKNPLFVSAAKTYVSQMELVTKMQRTIAEDGETCTKEYVKGRENMVAHPLVEQLPKHIDAANRTLNTMLTIITEIGHEPQRQTRLAAFVAAE